MLEQYKNNLKSSRGLRVSCGLLVVVLMLMLLSFFDRPLATGLLFLFLISAITLLCLYRANINDRNIYLVFGLGFFIHLGVVLFLYYTGFQPFGGGGDFTLYNSVATQIAERFTHGNFSLAGLYTEHFFPILIGLLYIITMPAMIVGQLFIVWWAAITILLVYLIVLELGGTKKVALGTSLVTGIYPSYLYFCSV